MEDPINYAMKEEFNPATQKLLTILPMASSIVSLICSARVIRYILWTKSKRKLLGRVYHRTIFIISLLDVIFSANAAVAAFMIPQGTPNVFWAFGNKTTCIMSGSLWQFGFVSTLYNAALSFYFVLQVRYRIQDKQYSKFVEPFVHILCFIYAMVSTALGSRWKVYAPSPEVTGWCFASGGHNNWCQQMMNSQGNHTDNVFDNIDNNINEGEDQLSWSSCQMRRKKFYTLFVHLFISPIFCLVISSLVVNMVILYLTVRNQEKKLSRYGDTSREMKLSQRVAARGLKFICCFLFTHIWLIFVFQTKNHLDHHHGIRLFFLFMLKIMQPLQGLWTSVIYFESRRRDNHDQQQRIGGGGDRRRGSILAGLLGYAGSSTTNFKPADGDGVVDDDASSTVPRLIQGSTRWHLQV